MKRFLMISLLVAVQLLINIPVYGAQSEMPEIFAQIGDTSGVFSIAISPDGRYALSGSEDKTVRLWDISNGKEIAQFIGFRDGEWVVVTQEGYYNASQNGEKHLNARIENNVYGIENYREQFFRPDLVKLALHKDPFIKVEEGLKYVKTATSRDDVKIDLTKLKEASRIDPNLSLPYYMVGITCYELDWYECAIESLNTYLRLETSPSDINEVKQILTDSQQKLERINQIKKMMTKKRKWILVNYTPKTEVNPVTGSVSNEFIIDENGRMFAKHPYYHIWKENPDFLIIEKDWNPVEFYGLFFKYEYKNVYRNLSFDSFFIVKGEIIPSDPLRIVQKVYHSRVLKNGMKPKEKDFKALWEVIYEI